MGSGRIRAGMGLVAALVLSLGTITVGAAEQGTTTAMATSALRVPGGCQATRAIGAIRPGMTGIGWTTVRGDLAEPFQVRVLGTLHDGIGPGRDLVIIKVSDLAGKRVVRVGGGIWSGMSGSPVYIRGRLAGAISYSLSDGPSPVGGMTPARYMERLTEEAVHPGAAARSNTTERSVIRLAGALDRTAAAAAGRPAGHATVLRRLAVPIAASAGVGGSRSFVARQLRSELGRVRVVSVGAASASTSRTLVAPPHAGQNMAGVIARGDVTLAAIGTVTAVCHGRVIGFGHPMTGEGVVAYGAARAHTVTIVGGGDPYKLANIGSTFGTLDVDRLTGIRAVAGRVPTTLPVTARVRSDTSGRVRVGRTRVAMPDWMQSVAADHLMYDILAVDDRAGAGTAQLSWTIRGVRLDTGTSWSLHWTDRVTDTGDIAYASALRLYTQLDALVNDPDTQAQVRSVYIDATIGHGAPMDRVRRIEVSRNGGPWLSSGPIAVTGGDHLRVRVSLRPRTGRTYARVVALDVPGPAAGTGLVDVLGGLDARTDGCDPFDGTCPSTFGQLLDALGGAPRADDLVVALTLDGAGGDPVRVTATTRLDHVVGGERRLRIEAD